MVTGTESLEVKALRALAAHIGARVTSTTGGKHAENSYHYAAGTEGHGLAIDLAETRGPSTMTSGLKRIAEEVARLIGPQCAELIHAGGPSLRNGRAFLYGASTLAAHRSHVHVAVSKGFRWAPPVKEVRSMYDPPLSICASLVSPNGGVWFLAPDGAVYAFGAPYLGGANNQPYFAGRKAARLDPHPTGGYTIVATSGERYSYPAS